MNALILIIFIFCSTFSRLKHEFDPSVRDSLPEYNPLQDSNLQRFYANESNLKRLRQNGEITQNNDVICNLKEFNEYRQELHKAQLYYILMDLNRMVNIIDHTVAIKLTLLTL